MYWGLHLAFVVQNMNNFNDTPMSCQVIKHIILPPVSWVLTVFRPETPYYSNTVKWQVGLEFNEEVIVFHTR